MFSITPALADKMMKCDEPSMMEMQKKIDADVDPAMKKQVAMANNEMKMAMDAMHGK